MSVTSTQIKCPTCGARGGSYCKRPPYEGTLATRAHSARVKAAKEITGKAATDFWTQSYYPWITNGWVTCACGETFQSDGPKGRGITAVVKHAEHVERSHR